MDDLREGKPTWLIAVAWKQAGVAQRTRITALHGNPDLDAGGAAELREIITATGARSEIEPLITTRTAHALRVLDQAPLDPATLPPLRYLAKGEDPPRTEYTVDIDTGAR
jgi:geranylgeranyl diphosphate synthase type I